MFAKNVTCFTKVANCSFVMRFNQMEIRFVLAVLVIEIFEGLAIFSKPCNLERGKMPLVVFNEI